jgi:hypothetical protein
MSIDQQPADVQEPTPVPSNRYAPIHVRSTARPISAPTSPSRTADYVTVQVAAAMTGYSIKAIRRKIEAGVWVEGREFRRAPDGHVLISMKGYELWVERGRG